MPKESAASRQNINQKKIYVNAITQIAVMKLKDITDTKFTTSAFFKEDKIWAHWLIFARIALKGE